MAKYSAVAMDHFFSPRNHGPLEEYDYEGNATVPSQTAFLRVYLRLQGEIVERASFVTFGCAAAIASGSVLTEMIAGRTIEECRRVNTAMLMDVLGELPADRQFCVGLALTALGNALSQIK